MSRSMTTPWRLVTLLLGMALVVACSGAETATLTAETGNPADAAIGAETGASVAGDGENLATFEERVAEEYAAMTGPQLAEPPSSGPPAQPGKSIAIVVITLEDAGAARVHAGVQEAADMLGWSHPVGATGARILATLAHELHRREGRFGLETMCIGGGQGLAAVWERVA